MYDAFISYSSHDERAALLLKDLLRRAGYHVFLAADSISPGARWSQETTSALETATNTIVLVSPSSTSSPWVQQEIGRSMRDSNQSIIPVLLGKSDECVPGWLGEVQGVRLVADDQSHLERTAAWIVSRMGGVQSIFPSPRTIGQLCLRRILVDQYEKTALAGAWSREYTRYLQFYYPGREIPTHVSRGVSITFSSMIVERILEYRRTGRRNKVKPLVDSCIDSFVTYLTQSQDVDQGGFGRRSQEVPVRGPTSIIVDLRHTCWALMSCIWLSADGWSMTERGGPKVERAFEWLENRLQRPRADDSTSWTAAAVHKLVSMDYVLRNFGKELCDRAKEAAEKALIGVFNSSYSTWDVGPGFLGSPERGSIDNALYIIGCLREGTVQSAELRRQRSCAISGLTRRCVPIGGSRVAKGLPMLLSGPSDYGASAEFARLLEVNSSGSIGALHGQLCEFLKMWPITQPHGEGEFPWYHASALCLPTIASVRVKWSMG